MLVFNTSLSLQLRSWEGDYIHMNLNVHIEARDYKTGVEVNRSPVFFKLDINEYQKNFSVDDSSWYQGTGFGYNILGDSRDIGI